MNTVNELKQQYKLYEQKCKDIEQKYSHIPNFSIIHSRKYTHSVDKMNYQNYLQIQQAILTILVFIYNDEP